MTTRTHSLPELRDLLAVMLVNSQTKTKRRMVLDLLDAINELEAYVEMERETLETAQRESLEAA